ncbi:uncharacterized protein LOC144139391 [Haemaphysalis longicornis]
MATSKRETLLSCPYDPGHIVPIGSYQRHLEECRNLHTKKDEPPPVDAAELHSAENWAKKMVHVTVVDRQTKTSKRRLDTLRNRLLESVGDCMVTNEMIGLASHQRLEASMERPREMNDALEPGRNPYKRREDRDATTDNQEFWRHYEGTSLLLSGNNFYYGQNDPSLGGGQPHCGH